MSDEFFPRDNRQPRHFWADNEIIDQFGAKLGANGIAVYMALARSAMNNSGECKSSMRKIAGQIGVSAASVFNALSIILQLGLARKIDEGDNRRCATYVLADVKAITDPNHAQLRLTASVHIVNAESPERSIGERSVQQANSSVQPVNAAFNRRTPIRKDKTSLQDYKTKTKGEAAAPPPKFSQSDFDERDLRKIGIAKRKLNEWLETHPSSGHGMSNGDYYARIAEEAGLTVKRILKLEDMQREWPEPKGESA